MKFIQYVLKSAGMVVLFTLLLACNALNTPEPPETKDGMELVYIPEGEFLMGTSDEQKERLQADHLWERWNSSEQPQRTIYLDAFWMDKTEVSNAQYALCVSDGACQEPFSVTSNARPVYYGDPEYANYPVIFVDWYAAQAYCAWAGRRLPTEAEWEKAARGTDGRTFPWGEGLDDTRANYGGSACETCDTTAVGSYPQGASPYGALDMAGNAYEWVADTFDNTYYQNSPAENPPGPNFEGHRAIRGGSWAGIENSLRTAGRYGYKPDYIDFPSMGFRCAVMP